jgi:Leucine-rich repeat (LRR) protein
MLHDRLTSDIISPQHEEQWVMATTIGRKLRRAITDLIESRFTDRNERQAFIEDAFFEAPTLKKRIKPEEVGRVFAANLVKHCLEFGNVQGEPAIIILLDTLLRWVGEDHSARIHDIRKEIDAKLTKSDPDATQDAPQIPESTDDLIEYFYDQYELKAWEGMFHTLSRLRSRKDLPENFKLKIAEYEAMIESRIAQSDARIQRAREYKVLYKRTRVEDVAVVWVDLRKFWSIHPDYDPENLMDLGRDLEYIRLHEIVLQNNPRKLWIELRSFWKSYPHHDPDNLAHIALKDNYGYGQALKRIEDAISQQHPHLDLSGLELEVLPPEIGYLQHLKSLNLDWNRLEHLPDSLVELEGLEKLSLDDNALTVFPAQLLSLTQLKYLDLSNNLLHVLPRELELLSQLNHLDVNSNMLRSLPSSIGQLRNLQVLVAFSNRLTELPASLFTLDQLSWLFLNNNKLVYLPPEFAQLQQLNGLLLGYNRLLELPIALGQLPNLSTLIALPGNPLTKVPEQIRKDSDQALMQWLRQQAGV